MGQNPYGTLNEKLWGMLPDSLQDFPLVAAFFLKVKLKKPDTCLCKLCTNNLHQSGYN